MLSVGNMCIQIIMTYYKEIAYGDTSTRAEKKYFFLKEHMSDQVIPF